MARKGVWNTQACFWKKVLKTDSCWLWQGSVNNKGYGEIKARDAVYYVHRYSWEIHRGSIPDKLCVLHICDTPTCVNPEHLFLGTQADNMRDMYAKGRDYRGPKTTIGEKHGMAKLTEEEVRTLRSYPKGTSPTLLADKFGISLTHVWQVRSRKVWRHIP
jgi:hypothetical protein